MRACVRTCVFVGVGRRGGRMGLHTLFANEAVIPVIGVVCVPCDGAAPVAYNSKVKLCRDNAVSYPRSEEDERKVARRPG